MVQDYDLASMYFAAPALLIGLGLGIWLRAGALWSLWSSLDSWSQLLAGRKPGSPMKTLRRWAARWCSG